MTRPVAIGMPIAKRIVMCAVERTDRTNPTNLRLQLPCLAANIAKRFTQPIAKTGIS
jgi:hypothetical protein